MPKRVFGTNYLLALEEYQYFLRDCLPCRPTLPCPAALNLCVFYCCCCLLWSVICFVCLLCLRACLLDSARVGGLDWLALLDWLSLLRFPVWFLLFAADCPQASWFDFFFSRRNIHNVFLWSFFIWQACECMANVTIQVLVYLVKYFVVCVQHPTPWNHRPYFLFPYFYGGKGQKFRKCDCTTRKYRYSFRCTS